MKLEIKFNIGDEVITPISDRIGRIKEIKYTCVDGGQTWSSPRLLYLVKLPFIHKTTSYFYDVEHWFNGSDLQVKP